MVERVWGDRDPPLAPPSQGEGNLGIRGDGGMGSMGEIKKYISSPKPMQDYLHMQDYLQ
ncbi:hypothetical protein [Okeania sp. SIO2C2]|uniref:hypothetical protein n=1 Tax=Okeania sp. SIO2C2 TaxID=2607787 RepID=UPI00257E8216|nr:hypothetical protein [Okeania sp. SIO2C2]